jgi:O-antigen/teichoic acid export membrane protein
VLDLSTVSTPAIGTVPQDALSKRGLLKRVGVSTLDQAIVSGAGFLIGIFVARWGSPVQFGAYATVLSFQLFASGIHSSLVIEPLGVIAPRVAISQLKAHLISAAMYSSVVASGLGVVVGLATAALLGSYSLAATAALVCPVLLSQLFTRRSCYAADHQQAALIGSGLYLGAGFLALYLTHRRFSISATQAYGALAIGAVTAIAGSVWRLSRSLGNNIDTRHETRGPIWPSYVSFGSWLTVCYAVGWLNNGFYVPVVTQRLGLEQAGMLRAADTLFTPMDQFVTSLAILLVPLLSARYGGKPRSLAQFPFLKLQILVGVATVFYALVVFLKGSLVLRLFYGSEHFSAAAIAIPGIALALIANGLLNIGPGLKLRILADTRGLFLSSLAGALVSACVGIPLVTKYGLAGAAGGRAIASLSNFTVATILARQWRQA